MCEPTPIETEYSEAMQKAVGLLFLTAGNVEAALAFTIARCVCYPHQATPAAVLAFAGMEIKLKLQTLENCIRLIAPENKTEMSKLAASIRRQFDHRNTIAHNVNHNPGDGLMSRPFKMLSKGLRPSSTFSDTQITTFARIMTKRTKQINDLVTRSGVEQMQ
jgi:hypothetical protein